MKKLSVVLISVIALSVLAVTAVPASAAVYSCHTRVYKDGPIWVTSARNMSCQAAAKEQRRYEWTGKNRFRTPGGFRCRPSGRGDIGYQIRCVHRAPYKAYRIEFAD